MGLAERNEKSGMGVAMVDGFWMENRELIIDVGLLDSARSNPRGNQNGVAPFFRRPLCSSNRLK
jgi:hypothetical protein